MVFINFKDRYNGNKVETVDEFETTKEAREMAKEYNLGDKENHYYMSSRCTKDWRNR